MPNVTYQQTNFLGGEWSPFFQGRTDHPRYRTAMNLSRNGFPMEEGAWVRRPGTRLIAPTAGGKPAKLLPIHFTNSAPYVAEFTDGYVRFYYQSRPVARAEFVAVLGISTDNPAVLTLLVPMPWAQGDEIGFFFVAADISMAQQLRQRIFKVTPVAETYASWSSSITYNTNSLVTYNSRNYISLQDNNTNHQPDVSPTWWSDVTSETRKFQLFDAVTGAAVDGSQLVLPPALAISVYAMRGLKLQTPYTAGSWETLRIVQNKDVAILMNGVHIPQLLVITPNPGSPIAATAVLKPVRFLDGPYLDPVANSVADVSGTSGIVTITCHFQDWNSANTYAVGDYVRFGTNAYRSLAGANTNNQPDISPTWWVQVDPGYAVTGPNNQQYVGFQSTDVGRLIRLFSEPPDYNPGTNYSAGTTVKYNGLYYTTNVPVSNVQPDLDPVKWAINPSGATYTWAQITQVINSNTVQAQIMGPPIQWPGVTVRLWRLGVYSDTTGWPTCGIFSEGRFWFGGAQSNRFDASYVDGVDLDGNINMAPTMQDGTVTDANGFGFTIESEEQNPIRWMAADPKGILVGTDGGEFLIFASQNNDAFTPTTTEVRLVTKYRCADAPPVRTGIALLFIQKFKRRIMEFLADIFTGRFVAPHLTEAAKHLTADGIEEIWYQEELAPVVWFRTGAGDLNGCTYRRTSTYIQDTPAFAGFHRHDLGHGRTITSITTGPSGNGALDALFMVTTDGTTNWVEQMTQMFDEDDNILDAWFVDGGIVPDQYGEDTVNGVQGIRFTGLWYLAGKTVSVFAAGLDVGDFTVDANGTVFVPYGSGVAPPVLNYSQPGAGAWAFTRNYVQTLANSGFVPRNGPVGANTTGTVTVTTNPNPNPNGSTSKIQLLNFTTTPSLAFSALDWSTGYLFAADQASPLHNIIRLNINTGAQVDVTNVPTLTGVTGAQFDTAAAVDRQGHLYFGINPGNYAQLVKVNEADMSLGFVYGTGGPFGPPNTPGIASPSLMAAPTANSPWIISISSVGAITFNSGTDGHFVAGNASNDPNFEGVNGTPWSLRHINWMQSGSPTYGNNVASTYVVTTDNQPSVNKELYFIGVADGVPTEEQNNVNQGSLGKKGKGKKGAQPGGVTHIPSTSTPLTYFSKIANISHTDVDTRWTNSEVGSCIVDWQDNSVLTFFTNDFTNAYATSDTQWSATTVYRFDPTQYPTWAANVTYPAGSLIRGATLTNNKAVLYRSKVQTSQNPEDQSQTDWVIAGHAFLLWSATQTYAANDYVLYNNVLFQNTQNGTVGVNPPNSPWVAVTTFTTGVVRERTTVSRWWDSVAINNLGHDPADNITNNLPFPQVGTYWQRIPSNYLASYDTGKFSRNNNTTFHLKWFVPLPDNINSAFLTAGGPKFTFVKGGLLAIPILSPPATKNTTFILVDTTTGRWFAGDVPGVSYSGGFDWDDQSQSIVLYSCSYDPTVPGAPVGLNGTVAFSNQPARLYLGNLQPNGSYSSTLQQQPSTYTFTIIQTQAPTVAIPCAIGYSYQSQGQILRQVAPPDSGAANGPAFGKIRRAHRYMALLRNVLDISFGTSFSAMIPAKLTDFNTGLQPQPTAPYSGIWRDALEAPYDFECELGWQIVRPYPASVVSVGVAIRSQDV